MKTNPSAQTFLRRPALWCYLMCAAILTLAPTVWAAATYSESANYSPGNLKTQANSSTGNTWANDTGAQIVAGGLTYSGFGNPVGTPYGVISVPNSASTSAKSTSLTLVGSSSTATPQYVSFLLKVSANPGATALPVFQLSLTSQPSASDSANECFTVYVKQGADTSHYYVGVQTAAGTIVYESGTHVFTDTLLVIAKYDYSAKTASVWVNPSSSSFGAVSEASGATTTTVASAAIKWKYWNVWNNVASGSPTWTIDNIRQDTAWANVTPAAPAAPTAAAATSVSTSGFTANWATVSGATGYYLDVATDSGFTSLVSGYNNLDVGNVLTKAVTGLSAATTYYYRVRAYTATLFGDSSSTIIAYTALTPTIASPTKASIASTTATLGATVSADGGANISDYGVVWAPASTTTTPTTANNKVQKGTTDPSFPSTYTVSASSLPAGTLIYYGGYALNPAGTAYSTYDSFYTLSTAPSSQAGSFSAAAASSSSINLSWTAASGSPSGYLILQKVGASAPTATPANATAYTVGSTIGSDGYVAALITSGSTLSTTISSLSASSQYSYMIYAFGYDGSHAATYNYLTTSAPTVSATTQTPVTPPNAPTTSAATSVTSTGFSANWASGGGGPVGYKLDVSTDPAFGSFFSGYNDLDVANVTTYAVTGLNPNTTYYYRVLAYNANGNSSYSTPNISMLTAPAAPTVQAATSVTRCGFSANWSVSTGATGYYLDVATDSGFATPVSGYNNVSVGNVLTYAVSGLNAGTPYYYRVRAINGATSPDSSSSNPTTSSALTVSFNTGLGSQTICAGSPVTFTVTASGGSGSYTYSWTENGSTIGGATSSSYNNSSVATTDAGSYVCTVSDGSGCSTVSATATLTVPQVTSSGTGSQTVSDGATATFGPVTASGGTLSYQWQVNSGSSWVNVSGATSSSYTTAATTAANNGYQYRCQVTSGSCSVFYSATATLSVATWFRSPATGPWTTAGTWQVSVDGNNGWQTATTVPTAADTVEIQAGHNITVPDLSNGNAGKLTIDATGTLTLGTAKAATVTINGDFINNGVVSSASVAGDTLIFAGTTAWSGAGTINTTKVSIQINSGATVTLGANAAIYIATGVATCTINGTLNTETYSLTTCRTVTIGATATIETKNTTGVFGTASTGIIYPSTYYPVVAAGVSYIFDGTSAQATAGIGITGASTAVAIGSLTINNSAGVTLSQADTVNGTLTLTSGKLITTSANLLTVASTASISGASSSSYINGPLDISLTTSSTGATFPVGDASVYAPVSLASATVTAGGDVVVNTVANNNSTTHFGTSGLSSSQNVNRDWTITAANGFVESAGSLTLNFAAGDIQGSMSTSADVSKKYASSAWTMPTVASRTGTSITLSGITAFGDFVVGQQTAATIASTSGNSQSGTVASALANPCVVTVTDGNGDPVAGTSVTFAVGTVPSGATGASVSGTQPATTGVNGQASSTLTLGTKAGAYTVTATSSGLTGSPITFNETGTAGNATTIAKSSGDAQSASVTTALSNPIKVLVTDTYGNPKSGVSVTFAFGTVPNGASGQTLGTANATSDVNGLASTTVTLGAKAGTYHVSATSGSLSGSPLDFTATGTAGSAATIAISSGNGQSATVTTTLSSPLVALVTDANGNPVSGTSVTFAVGTVPSGTTGTSVSGTQPATTDVNGQASTTLTLGTKAGTYHVSATSSGLSGSPLDFTATGTGGAIDHYSVTIPAGGSTGVSFPVTVTALDTYGNTSPDTGTVVTMSSQNNNVLFDGTGDGSYNNNQKSLASGTFTINAKDNTVETTTVTATDGNSKTGTSGSISILSQKYFITLPGETFVSGTGNTSTPNTQTAGTAFTLEIRVVDDNTNLITGFNNTGVALTYSGPHNSPGANAPSYTTTVDFVNGVAQTQTSPTQELPATLYDAETQTISVTDGTIAGKPSSGLTVNPAATASYQVSAGTTQTAGVSFPVTLDALDTYGNTNTLDSTTSVTLSGGAATYDVNPQTLTSGQFTVNATDNTAESLTIHATDGTHTGNSASITANPNTVSASVSTVAAGSGSVTTDGGAATTITITLKDVYGNPVSGKTVTLAQALSGGGTSHASIGAASELSSGSGVVTFNVSDTTVESVKFTATDSSDSTAITQTATVAFTAGAVSVGNSTVSAASGSVTTDGGATTTITVTLKDAQGNPIAGKTVTLAQTLSGGGTSHASIGAASGTSSGSGVVTFSVGDTTAESVKFTATDSSDSNLAITQTATVTFTAGAAVNVAYAYTSGDNQSGGYSTALASPCVVKVTDANGNPVSGVSVTFAVGTVPTGATGTSVSGTQPATTTGNGQASTTLTFGNLVGNYTVTATASGLTGSPLTFTETATARTWYSKPTTIAVATAANWTDNTAGTGNPAPDFNHSGDTFHWQSGSTATAATLTLGSGVNLVVDGGTLAMGSSVLTVGGTTTVNGSGVLTGSGANTFTGDVNFNSSGASTLTSSTTVTFSGKLTVGNGTGGSLTFAGSTVGVAGLMTVNAGASILDTTSGFALNLGGGLYCAATAVLGNFTATSGTIPTYNFTGSGTFTPPTTITGSKIDWTVGSSATLTMGGTLDYQPTSTSTRTFVVSGTIDFGTSGYVIQNSGAQVHLTFTLNAGATFKTGAATGVNGCFGAGLASETFTAGANYVFYGSQANAVTGAALTTAPANVTINNVNGVGLSGNLTVSGILALQSGALSIGAHTLTLNGTVSTTSGSLTGSSTSLIAVGGSSAVTLPAVSGGLNSLTVNDAGGVAINGAISLGGTTPALGLTAGAVTGGGNLTLASGTTITRAAGSLTGTPTFSGPVNVTYNGTTSITPGAELPTDAVNLNNLTLNGSGLIVNLANDLTVNGTPTVTAGTLAVGSHTLTLNTASGSLTTAIAGMTFTSSSSLTVGGGNTATLPATAMSLNNLTLSGTSTLNYLMGVGVLHVYGNLNVGGSATLRQASTSGTLTVDGSTTVGGTAATISKSSATPATTFNGAVTINSGGAIGGTPASACSWTLGSDLTVNGGSLTENNLGGTPSVGGGSGAMTCSGNFTLENGGTYYPGTGVQLFNGTGSKTLTGTMTIPTAEFQGNYQIVNGLTINTGLTLTSGNVTSAGNITLANGATITRATGTLDAAPTFGTSVNVTYTGSTSVTTGFEIPTTASVLANLTDNNTATAPAVTLGANTTVNGACSVGAGASLSVPANKTLELGSAGTMTVNASGLVAVQSNGTLKNSGAASDITTTATTLTFAAGASYLHNPSSGVGTIPTAGWNAASTCSVVGALTGTSAPGGLSQSFGNFTWNPASQGFSIGLGGSLTSVAGTLTVAASGSGNYIGMASTQSPTISIGSLVVSGGELDLSTGAGVPAVTVNGDVTLSGGTLVPSVATFNVKGNWVNNSGTFTPGSGSVTFNGTTAQSIGGSQSTTFNSLSIANTAAAVSLGANETINGTLTLTSGAFAVGANTLTLNGPAIAGTPANLATTSSSSLVFGGSSSGVAVPSSVVALNGLTINNSAGVSLNSSPTLMGTLTLTSGAFAVGANTLTLNGPAITGTPANLSTTSSSTLVFGGSATGVSVPSSVTALNNLTINNTDGGGVALNSSPTLAGTLTVGASAALDFNSQTLTTATTPSLGGTLKMEVSKTGPSVFSGSKLIRTGGLMTYGGALTVTAAGNALAGGDKIDLFDAGSFGGSFSGGITYPSYTLQSGENWSSADLTVDGSILINRAPTAGIQYLTVTKNNTLMVSAATLAGLSYDADGQTRTITGVSGISTNGPANNVTLSGGNLSYTPATDFVGADQFTYTIDDGHGGTATVTAKVTVKAAKPSFNAQLIDPTSNPGHVTVRGYGIPGNQYDVQRSSDSSFSAGSITTFGPVTAAGNGVVSWTDDSPPEGSAFYRLVVH